MMYLFFVICMTFFALSCADLASEQAAHSVELKFYRLQSSTWNSGSMETTLAGLIASEANTYCASNSAACGLYACCNAAFKEIDVGKDSDYPQDANKDMKYKLYLKIPAGSDIRNDSSLEFVISKSTLQSIIGNIRNDVKDDIGYYITYVGDDFYGIPPASLANRIIIPIACVLLLIMIIIAIALHFWNKKRMDDERVMRKVIKRKEQQKKAKEQPEYKMATEEPIVPPSPDKKTTEEKIYTAKLRDSSPVKQVEAPKKHFGGASDTDSAIKMEERNGDNLDAYDVKYQGLPPLKTEIADDKKERKKKKKEKKKKKTKRRHADDGADNTAYLGGASDDDGGPTTEL